MATTKIATVIWNAENLAAAGGPTTSSAIDLADGYGAGLSIKLTNGATGPTTEAEVQVETSKDNTEWYKLGNPVKGSTTNSDDPSWADIPIPIDAKHVRLVATHPTGQDVTVDADLVEVTAI